MGCEERKARRMYVFSSLLPVLDLTLAMKISAFEGKKGLIGGGEVGWDQCVPLDVYFEREDLTVLR